MANEDLIKVHEETKGIEFNFQKIYNLDETVIPKEYNLMNLKKKRSYINIVDKQVELINQIVNATEAKEYLHKIFRYKAEFEKAKALNQPFNIEENFYKYLSNDILDLIDEVVDRTYSINIESETDNSNEQIQMSNEQAKTLIKVSYAIKAYTFIILDSLADFSSAEFNVEKVDRVLFNCFTRYFFGYFQGEKDIEVLHTRKITPNEVSLENKLKKIVSSRIISTKYSDRVIWNYLKNLSSDPSTIREEFFIDVISNILAKVSIDGNVAVFLHSVLNNKLEHLFRSNNKIEYIAHNTQVSEDDSYHKIEHKMKRNNEGTMILARLAIKDFIDFHGVSKEEIDYYSSLYQGKTNKYQVLIVSIFAKKFNLNCSPFNYKDYIAIKLVMHKFLIKNNLLRLAYNLIHEIDEESFGSSFYKHSMVISLPYYKKIIDKYSILNDKIHDQKLLFNIIDMVVSTKRKELKILDKDNENLPKAEQISPEILLAEILKFLDLCL